jgi:hypothetical protein
MRQREGKRDIDRQRKHRKVTVRRDKEIGQTDLGIVKGERRKRQTGPTD